MKEEPIISVIVPIYKVEQYLSRCVSSILSQTFADFELLLIDDGSPDRCGEICDEWASKDYRVRVFHQENSGVSVARNRGLDHATGKYVVFVDPDDWILPDYCLGLYNLQAAYSGRGLVIQGMLCRRTDGTSLPSLSLPDRYLPFSSIGKSFAENNICEMGYAVSKIYARSIIEEFSIRFDENIHCLEDLLFMYQYLLHCDYLVLNHMQNYVYVKHSFSLSHRIHSFESEYCCFVKYQQLLAEMMKVWKILAGDMVVTVNSMLVPFRRALKSDYQPDRTIPREMRVKHLKRMISESRDVFLKYYHPVFKTDKLGKVLLGFNCYILYDFYIRLLFRLNIGPVFYGPKHMY